MYQRLVSDWRELARLFREHEQHAAACVYDKCADELEALALERGSAPLTLDEAAALGGYSRDHLGRLVRNGKIPNAGLPGSPRIALKDVPIKAGRVAGPTLVRDIDRTQIVRSAINEGAG